MAGEFAEILKLLFSAVVWALKVTSYVACTVLLLIACLVPWRVPCILLTAFGGDGVDDYREFCVVMFAVSCLDAIAVPLGAISALVPTCTAPVVYGTCVERWQTVLFTSYSQEGSQEACALRCFWLSMFCMAIVDCFVMPLGLLSFLAPTRLPYGCSTLPRLCLCGVRKDGEAAPVPDTGLCQCGDVYASARSVRCDLLWNLALAAMDVVACLCAMLLCALPLRVYVAAADVSGALSTPAEDRAQWELEFGFSRQARLDLMYHAAGLLIDLLVLPFGFLSALMPTRTWYFFDLCAQLYCRHSCVDAELRFTREARAEADARARTCMFANLVFATFDVVSGLWGLLAVVTLMRSCQTWTDVQEALKKERKRESNFADTYNADVRFALLTNGIALALDVFFAPFLLVLGLTIWRAKPVVDSIRRGFDWTTRKLILQQSMSLAGDIVLLPFLLVVMFSWYRSASVRGIMFPPAPAEGGAPPAARGAGAGYHCTLLWSVFLLFCDVLILPVVCILVLTVYRVPNLCNAAEHEGLGFHSAVLGQLGELLCDMPFAILGFILLVTLVRADTALELLMDREKKADDRREEVCTAFGRLCGDVVTVFPMALVCLTLYRLPLLVAQWMAMWSPPLAGMPELELLSVSILSPKPSGQLALRIHARKPPGLHGLESVRACILGRPFWEFLGEDMGPLATIAQGLFPLSLKEKNAQLSAFVEGAETVTFDIRYGPAVHFTTVMNLCHRMDGGPPVCAQLESVCTDGSKALLLALGVPMDALREWAEQARQANNHKGETPFVPLSMERLITDVHGVSKVRGQHQRFKDAYVRPVWMQCGMICEDAADFILNCVHFLVWLFLLLSPPRFWMACRFGTEPHATRLARLAGRTASAFAAWERQCVELSTEIDEVAIQYVKSKASTRFVLPNAARSGQGYSSFDLATHCCEGVIGLCCLGTCPCCPNYVGLRDSFCDEEDLEDPTTKAGHPMWQGNQARHDLGAFLARARLDETAAILGASTEKLEAAARDAARDGEGALREEAAAVSFLMREGAKTWQDALWWQLAVPRLQEGYADRWLRRFQEEEDAERETAEARFLAEASSVVATTDWLRGQAGTLLERLETCRADVGAKLATLQQHAAQVGGQRPRRLRADWRPVVRRQALGALRDISTVGMLLLLVLTVYKLPDLSRDMSKAGSMRERRLGLARHVRALGRDIFELLQLIFLSAVLVVTVVKLPDYVFGFNPYKGLRKLNRWAMHNICELAVGIAELLLMVTFLKTYRTLLSSAMFAAFSPATVLAYAMPKWLEAKHRFPVACMFMISWFVVFLYFREHRIYVACGAMACFATAFVGLALNDVPGWMRKRDKDWWSPTARPTPLNNLALLIVAAEAVWIGLFALIARGGELPAGTEASEWLDAFEDAAEGIYGWIAVGVAAFTVVINAAPLIAEDDEERGRVTTHPQWLCGTMVLMELLLLPVAALLFPVVVPDTDDAPWLQSLIVFYYIFVAMLSPASWDAPLGPKANFDIRSIGMYGSGHRLLLLVAVAGAFLQWGYTVTILCAVDFLWALLFISRGCSVMWVQVLRLGVGGGGVAAGLCKSPEAAAVTWSLCIVLAVVLGARQHFNRRNERRQIDCFLLLTRLQSLVGRLALWGDRSSAKLALRADCTAHDGAFMLLEIEARLPIERLHPGFVRTRAAWRQRLWEQSYDFNAVLESARELDRAFYVPPSAVQLKRMLDQVRGGRGIPEWLAQEVLDFVGKAQGQRMHIVGKPAARTASWFLDSWVLRHLWKMSRDEIQYGLVSRQKESAPQQQQLAAPRQVGTSRSSSGLGGADRARRNDNEPVAVVLGRARSNLGTASWRGMMQDAVEEVGNGEYVPASKANLQSRQSSSNSIVDTI